MTRKELYRFAQILEDMKAEMMRALVNSLDRLVILQSADPMDQMRNFSEQDLDSRNISQLTARLRDLDGALKAIREGNFGRCAACDGEIPLQRLEAIPWSPLCVRCQETAEALQAPGPEANEPLEGDYTIARAPVWQ